MTAPLPGAVGLSALRVYPWEAADGLRGGSPHLHLCCTEAYLVVSGAGRLHTLTPGGFAEHRLSAGDVVWFTPGTIHRAVNDGDLNVLVLMQNSGLPEAGDAVLTFPPEHLTDRETYAAARALTGPDPEAAARRRRDLAVAGFEVLRDALDRGDPGPLERFYESAARLVAPVLDDWRGILRDGAAEAVRRTGDQLDALAAGDARHLREATVVRQERPADIALGMCGYLNAYPVPDARPARR